jgi:peroxiredoxin
MKFQSPFLFSLFFLFFCYSSFSQNDSSKQFLFRETQSVGKPFPLFYVKTDGVTWTNDSLKGKVVFINFWFESCPPCIAEMGPLNELYEKVKDSSNIVFMSISTESPEKIKLLKAKYHIPYTVASLSKKECYRLNQDNGYPTTIILDKKGVIRFLKSGGYMDEEKVHRFITEEVYQMILAELRLGTVSFKKI